MAHTLSASYALAGTPLLAPRRQRQVAPCRASALVVEDAATREAKGKTLERLGAKLKPEAQTMFIAGLNYKGFTVRIVAQSRACRVLAQVVAG
jgi:hypothetical protein